MATWPAVLIPAVVILGNINGRITRIPIIQPRNGDGTFHSDEAHLPVVAVHAPTAAPIIAPVTFTGVMIPDVQQPDWPDFQVETRSYTRHRDSTLVPNRLRDRFYGLAGRPRFTCSDLVPGLSYALTIALTEGPIGGPFVAYPSIQHIFVADAAVQAIDITLPIPAQGREVRVSGFSNVRYYA